MLWKKFFGVTPGTKEIRETLDTNESKVDYVMRWSRWMTVSHTDIICTCPAESFVIRTRMRDIGEGRNYKKAMITYVGTVVKGQDGASHGFERQHDLEGQSLINE